MLNLAKKSNIMILTVILIAGVLVWIGWQVMATNNGNTFDYSFSEKTGWMRMDGTDSTQTYGVTVPDTDGDLSGYTWLENAGWIHFAGDCVNTGECPGGLDSYAVVVDVGCSSGWGCLSGYAWGEGIGWIRFAATSSTYANDSSTTYGVYIDSNKDFQGYAWSEQVGWISFAGTCGETGGCPSGLNTYGAEYYVPPTYTLATTTGQTINVSGNLTIGDGTKGVIVTGATNDPNVSITGNVVVADNATFTNTDDTSKTLNIDGNLTINSTAGVFTAPAGTTATSFTLGGNFTNNGTFNHNSGTVTLDGVNQSLTGDTTFYNLTKQENTDNSTDSTLTIAASSTQTIDTGGTLDFDGLDDSDRLNLVSSTPGTGYTLDFKTGSLSATWLDVTDSFSVLTNDITCTNCGNISNNDDTTTPRWIFSSAGITVSGFAYADEATTVWVPCDGSTENISLVVNGGTAQTTFCDDLTGAYTFSAVTVALNNPVSVFFNATDKGVVVTVAADATTAIVLNPRKNIVWVKTEGAVANITNTNLDHCDSAAPAGCVNVPYAVTTAALTVESGFELHVENSKTYDPGGTVTTQGVAGNLHLDDNSVAYFDTNSNIISGDITVDTGATLNLDADVAINGGDLTSAGATQATAGTATFGVTGIISGAGSINFYNLATSGTGTTTVSNAISTDSDIAVGAGTTLKVNADATVNGGDFTNATTGIITTDANTPTVTMTAAGNVGGGSGAITFYNLATSGIGATAFSGSGTNTVNNNISVGAGTTLNINSSVSIAGSITNTTTGIIGTSAGTPTVTVSGATIGSGSGAIAFYNLTKAGAGATTFSGSGTNTVNNDLSVSAGTLNLSNALTVTGNGSVAEGATFNINANLNIDGGGLTTTTTGIINYTAGTPTVDIDGTGTLGGGAGAITFYSLDLGDGTVDTTTLSSTVSIDNNLTVNGSQTFTVGVNSVTVGSTAANSGGISVAASGAYNQTGGTTAIKSSSAGAATIGGAGTITFYNLSFLPAVVAAPTITLGSAVSQTINVSNVLTMGDGTNPVVVTVLTNDPTLNVDGDVSIAASGTLIASDSGAFTVGGSWTNSATGVFTHSSGTVTFDAGTAGKTITDGGDPFNNITFNGSGGEWLYTDGASTAPVLTTVQAGTPTYLNAKTGTVSVTGGVLNVDWYLGVHAVNAAATATNVDTGDTDITILESGSNATVWRHNGAVWGSGATSQTTGSAATGINPQPNNDGAIRIREYSNSAGTPTYYSYNLQIDWQTSYGQYDYYDDYTGAYVTSSLNSGTIDDGWYRPLASIGTINTPYDTVNTAPNQGSWYVGMLTGLDVTITGTSITFANLNLGNNFTNTASTQTQIDVTTSATNGYIVTAWETQKMTHDDFGAVTIDNFNVNSGVDYGDYADPLTWTNNCSTATPNNECGFGFTSNDTLVEGVNRYNNGTEYAGFSESSASPIRVIDYSSPADAVSNLITYRISASNTQRPGTYSTTIVYVVTAEY